MCYILAVFGAYAKGKITLEETRTLLNGAKKRAELMTHRGPDGAGYYSFPNNSGGIYHGRLALVDAKSGAQPLFSEDRTISVSVNGEIYNHEELKILLRDKHTFATASDCEVISHLFEERGEEMIQLFNGMFCFVLHDDKTNKMIIARDHVGMLPLYWGVKVLKDDDTESKGNDKNRFKKIEKLLADIPELLEKVPSEDKTSGVIQHISPELLKVNKTSSGDVTPESLAPGFILPRYSKYIASTSGVKWTASELKSIQDDADVFEAFPPGHIFIGDSITGIGEIKRWYKPDWIRKDYMPPLLPVEECISDLRKHIVDASIPHWTMCDPDVKKIIALSGGVDSSGIVGIIAEYELKTSGRRIHTCTTGIISANGEILSEDVFQARKVAVRYNTIHQEFLYTMEQVDAVRKEVCKGLETTYLTTNRAACCQYLMARDLKRLGFKKIQDASGPDESSGGYKHFHSCPSEEEMMHETRDKVLGLSTMDLLRAAKIYGLFGIEVRMPYLHKPLLDYWMNKIHPRYKMCRDADGNPRIEKWILREALKEWLPKDIYLRSKVQFSDGVGSILIDSIKEDAKLKISDEELKNASILYPYGTPTTHEGMLLRKWFDEFYPHPCAIRTVPIGTTISCSTPRAMLWNELFKSRADDSGRSIS